MHSAILNSVRTTAVVADQVKFNRLALVCVANFEKVNYLITVAEPEPEIAGAQKPLEIELQVANGKQE